ncbi:MULTISPECIES: BrnT family toxin [unclassified Janthinobacterium]|uniref:BrnT family toxin n=1 Tax=unclassified Janthinobacterium TaxID=2610881 RepID=UPI00288C2D57|nr:MULTISPECIES: BrnT family toxin [unclassified Janthinobacterium]
MVYGEQRFITVGWLDERLVVLVWTQRGLARRIISMRKANEREIAKYSQSLA